MAVAALLLQAAALLLGLSRQSLYVKLRRYGMVSAAADDDEG